MAGSTVVTLLWRLILPLSLLAAVSLRANGLSVVYLCLLLAGPAVHTPKAFPRSGAAAYVVMSLVFSLLACLGHSAFQIYLLVSASAVGLEYGQNWPCSSTEERIARYAGFQRLDFGDALHVCRLILPDCVVLIISIITAVAGYKLLPVRPPGEPACRSLDRPPPRPSRQASRVSMTANRSPVSPRPRSTVDLLSPARDGAESPHPPQVSKSRTRAPPLRRRLTEMMFETTSGADTVDVLQEAYGRREPSAPSVAPGEGHGYVAVAPWVYDLCLIADLLLVLLSAILVPSALSLPYFIGVIAALACWPLTKEPSRRFVFIMQIIGSVYLGLHTAVLYAGQTGLFREDVAAQWNENSEVYLILRVLGLDPLLSISCPNPWDPQPIVHSWPYYCLLPVLYVTYTCFVFQLRWEPMRRERPKRLPTTTTEDVRDDQTLQDVSPSPAFSRRGRREETQVPYLLCVSVCLFSYVCLSVPLHLRCMSNQ